MKLVILAGGLGSRLSEETVLKPKPMVEIGDKPIIWHIMKLYSYYGINDFIICCGYKGEVLKEYFYNYFFYNSDIEINLRSKNKLKIINNNTEDWNIKLIDTGLNTMTGGRLKRIQKYIKKNEDFCMTYGDGLSDLNINNLIKFHKKSRKFATMTAVSPSGRFGAIVEKNSLVLKFEEKPQGDGLINGGFFVLNEKIFRFIKKDEDVWEQEPLSNIVKKKQLVIFKHKGFWQPMDTVREKNLLCDLWKSNKPPWKKWK